MPIMNYWAIKKVDVVLCKSRAYYWVKKAICILTDITGIINTINSYWAPTFVKYWAYIRYWMKKACSQERIYKFVCEYKHKK